MRLDIEYDSAAGARKKDLSYLDFRYLHGLVVLGKPASNKIAEALEKLAKEVDLMGSGGHQLNVLTQTKAERKEEQEEQVREWQARRAAAATESAEQTMPDGR